MRFIKKLVILTGGGARGTLMLEKNGYGVWGKLNIFDLTIKGDYRFVLISGDELFAMRLKPERTQTVEFELGEMDFEHIHAAVVGTNVVMYGSNCATKLSPEVIMNRLRRGERRASEEETFFTFSGKGKSIDDYFKEIAPPEYNDFAIADRNYYPAYVSLIDEVAASASEEEPMQDENEIKEGVTVRPAEAAERATSEPATEARSPHELERSFVEAAAATVLKCTPVSRKTAFSPDPGSETKPATGADSDPVTGVKPEPDAATKAPDPRTADPRANTPRTSDPRTSDPGSETKPATGADSTPVTGLKPETTNPSTPTYTPPTPTMGDGETTEYHIETIKPRLTKPATDERADEAKTPGEQPEVIAMARRVTLRDYKMTGKGGRKATYFERSSGQLRKLLDENERFEPAERLIPGSKFVRINYDKTRYYIVGVIGSDYICYGVPARYSEEPPEPLMGYARWLPSDADKPKGDGFWMMYQDGISGETLKSR